MTQVLSDATKNNRTTAQPLELSIVSFECVLNGRGYIKMVEEVDSLIINQPAWEGGNGKPCPSLTNLSCQKFNFNIKSKPKYEPTDYTDW